MEPYQPPENLGKSFSAQTDLELQKNNRNFLNEKGETKRIS